MNKWFDFPRLWNLYTLELIGYFGIDAFGDELRVFGLVTLPVESEQKL